MSIFPPRSFWPPTAPGGQVGRNHRCRPGQEHGSELHVVHVGESPLIYHPERHAYRAQYEKHEKESQQLLEAEWSG